MSQVSQLEAEVREWARELYRDTCWRIHDFAAHPRWVDAARADDRLGLLVPWGRDTPRNTIALPGDRIGVISFDGMWVHADSCCREDTLYAFVRGRWIERRVMAWRPTGTDLEG